MARAGLGARWRCAFANDIDPKKAASYVANWGSGEFRLGDVYELQSSELPGIADLAWASFPCQDLSLAGAGAGLKGERSGAFWGFWRIIHLLKRARRAPRLLVLENVCGTLTSHGGRDFVEIARALASLGYRFGAMVVDAALFLPQSRPRLFIICAHNATPVPFDLRADAPSPLWHPRALTNAHALLPPDLRKRWIWWRMPVPPAHGRVFADVIEERPSDVAWHTSEETARLLSQMSPINRAKVEAARRSGEFAVGAVYKRTRRDERGRKVQRAEVRFDDCSGCLRTPAGGSSRQIILLVNGKEVRSRLLSAREAARLMGLPDSYILPKNYNEGYHVAGDGLAVPVVAYIERHLLFPMAAYTDFSIAAE